MQRIDGPTASPGLTPPAPQSGTPGYFTAGDPSTSTPPTIVTQDFLNMIQEELCVLVTAGGLTPSKSNWTQVRDAIKNLISAAVTAGAVTFATDSETVAGQSTTKAVNPHGAAALVADRVAALVNSSPAALDTLKELADAIGDDPNFAATVNTAISARATIVSLQNGTYQIAGDQGPANALAASISPAPAGLASGMLVRILVNNGSTGAATLNLNGLGAKAITYSGRPLASGMLRAGGIYLFAYDGGAWQVLNPNLSGIFAYADRTTAGTDTVTVPAWASSAEVQIIGAGGAGGGSATGYSGGGGGAGGYNQVILAVTPGTVLTRVVGAGGQGSSGTGGAGGQSSLTNVGSVGGGGGGQAGTVTSAGGAGGSSANPGRNFTGGVGADGNASNQAVQGGQGASGPFGGGGRSGAGGGVSGNAPGAGGGGAWSSSGIGGAGADGAVLIRFLA